MAAFDTYRFQVIPAGGARGTWVPGSSVTLPTATTAEGLDKAGSITIDAHAGSATSVDVGNSGAGSVTLHVLGSELVDDNLTVTGDAILKSTTYTTGLVLNYSAVGPRGLSLYCPVSTTRTQNLPDADGDILVRNSASGVIDLNAYAIATFQLTRNGANCTFAFENAGTSKANVTSTGAMAQWGATPAASQPGAITDLTPTAVIAGADTVNALTLLSALNDLQNDMNSVLAALRSAGVIAT